MAEKTKKPSKTSTRHRCTRKIPALELLGLWRGFSKPFLPLPSKLKSPLHYTFSSFGALLVMVVLWLGFGYVFFKPNKATQVIIYNIPLLFSGSNATA